MLIVGRPQRRSVNRVMTALSTRLAREVNATISSPERWKAGAGGFIRQVKRGPVVELVFHGTET